MKKCTVCGKVLEDDIKACTKCGSSSFIIVESNDNKKTERIYD